MSVFSVDRFTFDRFVTCLFLLAVTVSACFMPAQSDTWWQLRTGEEMWRSHEVMLRDEFTHTVAGGYWPNHEWLAQVVFYATYRLGGLPMLTALCAAFIALSWGIVASLTPGRGLARIVLLGAGAVLSSPSWSLRPQVFTTALLAITIWIVVRRLWVWSLPPLFLLWANAHGAVALGGVVVAAGVVTALLVDRAQFRSMALIAIACLFCTAATPLAFTLWREVPSSLARLQSYGVLEWQAPGLAITDAPFWCLALITGVLLFICRSDLRTSWKTTSLALACLMLFALALKTRRNIPPFVLCAVPLIGHLLTQLIRQRASVRLERPRLNAVVFSTIMLASIVSVAVAWSEPSPRLAWAPVSSALGRAVTNCPGRLYNRYDDGGYLIWFVRDKKVFMDSRQDPFPSDLVLRHVELERSGDYTELFATYDIDCALTAEGSPLAVRLERDGWHSIGEDRWLLFNRLGPNPQTRLLRY
jgi:hypothetical protein